MPATPASLDEPRASHAASLPRPLPRAELDGDRQPAALTAARAIATARSGSSSSAAPSPSCRPSERDSPCSGRSGRRRPPPSSPPATRITSRRGRRAGPRPGAPPGESSETASWVRRSPQPKLDTISETASPAPWRRAWSRTNQFPIPPAAPARGDSAGAAAELPGCGRERIGETVATRAGGAVWEPSRSLPDQAQALQRQQSSPSSISSQNGTIGEASRPLPSLRPPRPILPQTRHDRVDLPAKPCAPAWIAAWVVRPMSAAGAPISTRQPRGPLRQRLHRDSTPGAITPPRYSPALLTPRRK